LDSLIATDATTLTGTLSGITLTAAETVSMDLSVNSGVATAYSNITIAQDGTFTISTINPDLANNDQADVSAVIGGVTVTGTGTVNDTTWAKEFFAGEPLIRNGFGGGDELVIPLTDPVVPGYSVQISSTTEGVSYTYTDATSTAVSDDDYNITIVFNGMDDNDNTFTPQSGDTLTIEVTNNGETGTTNILI
jgi:hypothetical protein